MTEGSAIRRRRMLATYHVNIARYQARTAWPQIGVLVFLLLVLFALRWLPPPLDASHDRTIVLNTPTQTHGFDRFYIEHKVTSGDTLSKISTKYYRRWSPENDKLLREANPDLPDDPRELTTSIIVKIPLK